MSRENRNAFKYARSLTAFYSKSFYISACMLPSEKKWATYGIYGFCRYVDNIVDNHSRRSPKERQRELNFIIDELEVAYRTGESEHPIVRAFVQSALKYEVPLEYPAELLTGVEMDLSKARYRDFDELYVFCYRVAAVVGLMMTHVFGYTKLEVFEYAKDLGIAMQLTNILRDVQEDGQRGRIYLPLEELHEFGCDENDVLSSNSSANLRALMKFQVERADRYYESAAAGVKLLSRDCQFAVNAALKIYRGILRKIERRDYNPFLGRVFVPKHTKVMILAQELVRTRVQGESVPVEVKRAFAKP